MALISPKRRIKPYLSEKFIYVHKKSSFPIQLGLGADHVSTKMPFVADDGFLIPSTLKFVLIFRKKSDFVAVNGMGIQFDVNKKY